MIAANNPDLKSWIEVSPSSDFPIQNLPFGVFQHAEKGASLATAIGDYVVDLAELSERGFFDLLKISPAVFQTDTLNDFMALGRPAWRIVRQQLSNLLSAANDKLQGDQAARDAVLHKMSDVKMLLPVFIGDYTDFYSSIEHATNIGIMFRGIDNALMPNWRHLPVGYHGRASSIVVSGTPVHRPSGQTRPNAEESPVSGPSRLLDIELEMAFIVGKSTKLGDTVSTENAEEHIFGMVAFNDWSARDIQKWEYVPLGPFLGKSFCSSISPWIVTLDALEPFRVAPPVQEPAVLPYLERKGARNFDIHLEVELSNAEGASASICQSNHKYLYWTIAQQLAHHTSNGCNINTGDMMASGTISGPEEGSYGSLLEITWQGTKPITLSDGSQRKFLLDGDTVSIKAHCEKDGLRIGFGEVNGTIEG